MILTLWWLVDKLCCVTKIMCGSRTNEWGSVERSSGFRVSALRKGRPSFFLFPFFMKIFEIRERQYYYSLLEWWKDESDSQQKFRIAKSSREQFQAFEIRFLFVIVFLRELYLPVARDSLFKLKFWPPVRLHTRVKLFVERNFRLNFVGRKDLKNEHPNASIVRSMREQFASRSFDKKEETFCY